MNAAEAKLTMTRTLHLNGGSQFSESQHEIEADGVRTGIILRERTNGRPEFRYTVRELIFGGETLDLMNPPEGVKPEAWVRERIGKEPPPLVWTPDIARKLMIRSEGGIELETRPMTQDEMRSHALEAVRLAALEEMARERANEIEEERRREEGP